MIGLGLVKKRLNPADAAQKRKPSFLDTAKKGFGFVKKVNKTIEDPGGTLMDLYSKKKKKNAQTQP